MTQKLEKIKGEALRFRKQLAKKTLNLVTSAFGLVAALAWNEVIKELINVYIKPFLGQSSGLISLLLYALIITFLAVLVTYNLGRFVEKK